MSFGLNISTNWKSIEILYLISINKYLLLDKILLRFILIRILLTTLLSLIQNHYFDWASILPLPKIVVASFL